MMRDPVSERPTLDSVEAMLEQYVDLGRKSSTDTIVERLELLAKLHLDLLLATRGLGPEERERVRFLFMRVKILEGCITANRQLELYRRIGE